MYLGHALASWLVPLFALLQAANIYGWWFDPAGAVAYTVAAVVIAVTYVVAIIATMIHDFNLCHRENFDHVLDPQAAVDKHRKRLRLYHNARRQYLLIGVIWVPVVFGFLPVQTYPIALKILASVFAVGALAAIIPLHRISAVHNKLQPWCPFCRRRDDGDKASEPTPDPVGTANH